MKQKLELLKQRSKNTNALYSPEFFYLANSNDKLKLSELIDKNPFITVFDELLSQLEELVKSKNPNIKFTKESLTAAAIEYIGTVPFEEYGVWVYYPWASRLVHVLDEEEFVYVRTNRNQYKITPEEEEILATKKIGVIGLSVGKAIALTIAMERICGEIRIADFDVIELSNLNRIQTGVHNFGVKKTVVVAREIAEIDPFLKVTCFSDGLTEENADDFFLKDGKLDVCIEVCDGLYTKIFSRQKAKSFCIPVVMNSSDRGTTDIERFDLHPELPLLHGLIDHLDLTLLKQASTNEEKIPYLLPMLGVETSSIRLKASMLEIGETITTWPQLASGVIFGGGICTDVCRRILLKQLNDSGRYIVDIENIICDKNPESVEKTQVNVLKKSLSVDEMDEIALRLNSLTDDHHVAPSEVQIKQLVEAAIKAPSEGNIQAWKWYYSKGNLYLFHDISKSDTLLDFDNLASYISFGAATENLILKSHQIGLNPFYVTFPLATEPRVICQFTFLKEPPNSKEKEYNHLVTEIENRSTNRTITERQIINSDALNELQQMACSVDGAQMMIVDSSEGIKKLAHVVSAMERLRMMDLRGHSDFVNEIRWTDKENILKSDGIDLNSLYLGPTAEAGFVAAKNWEVMSLLKKWNQGYAFEKLPKITVLNSSALGLITMPEYSPLSYFNAGRSIQRTWLMANKLNISFQPLSAATFFFARLRMCNGAELDAEFQKELKKLRKEFVSVFNLDLNTQDVFLFRLCIANKPIIKSLRRKPEDVLIYG